MKDMYFSRQIEEKIEQWYQQKEKLVLEIKGGRQVGKTTTILHFARSRYQNIIYVNLAGSTGDQFADILKSSSSTKKAILEFCRVNNLSYTDDESTILIVDEIQEDKCIYESIRSFNRELQCDVIITGSYLQRARKFFQPAGDVEMIEMFPMNFEEFILAVDRKAYEFYKSSTIEEIAFSDKLEWYNKCFEIYKEVGGYPVVVRKYLEQQDILEVRKAQRLIIQAILSELKIRSDNLFDFTLAESIFYSIVTTMIKEKKGNSRLIEEVSKLTESYSSFRISTKECYNVIAWLKEAGFLGYCDKFVFTNSNVDVVPAERLYFNDLGILYYLCKQNNVEDTNLNGILSETFIYKVLNEKDFSSNFKFTRPAFGIYNNYEVDFCVMNNAGVMYGIEVKTGRAQGISIKELLKQKKIDYAVYFKGGTKGGNEEKCTTVPLVLSGKYKFEAEDRKNTLQRLRAFS